MKCSRAILPIVAVTAVAGAAVWTVQSMADAVSRRLYFVSGWSIVLALALSLVALRSAHVSLRSGSFQAGAGQLWRDASLLGSFLVLAGLHLRMGLPEGVFEVLLFVVLAAISFLWLTLHLTYVGLAVEEMAGDRRALLGARAEKVLDLLLPLVLAAMPILLLHGVLSHAHGALSHLVKGGQP